MKIIFYIPVCLFLLYYVLELFFIYSCFSHIKSVCIVGTHICNYMCDKNSTIYSPDAIMCCVFSHI